MNEPQGTEKPKSKLHKIPKLCLKKIDLETLKLMQSIKDKANKKEVGRNVRDSEILALAVKQLNQDHIKQLQEATYSEGDRLQIIHEQFQKEHGRLSLDQFIGKLMRQEILIK